MYNPVKIVVLVFLVFNYLARAVCHCCPGRRGTFADYFLDIL